MPVYVNTFFEERVQQLFDLAELIDKIFTSAGLEYRIIGGLATFLYVEEVEPGAGRTTTDIDIVVRREDLDKIAEAAKPFGLRYRHVAGVDMLVRDGQPARTGIHFVFTGEKVRQEYVEPVPKIGSSRVIKGVRLIPLEDLIRMKLTSFRAKDEAHLKDFDEVGLITPALEADLTDVLRARLAQMRARG